ncbi:MAG: hypothetical protein R3C14_44090 [Caldilineaceae bacterium]
MNDATRQLIQAIHDSPYQLHLTVAGAGHGALSALLDVAGASRTLLEALIPYHPAAFADFLERTPFHYVAPETARLLAGRAFTRARQLVGAEQAVLGVACTAAIASDRPKRGEHRAHIAIWDATTVTEFTLWLEKGRRSRQEEEALVGLVILNAIAQRCQLTEQLPVTLDAADRLTSAKIDFHTPAAALATGELHYFGIQADGTLYPAETQPPVILSGSFNPLHQGHLGMARAAENMLGQPVTFELSAVNVDKPPLPTALILARMSQFAGRYPILASDAPTYRLKARLYPGATFVVGYDTAVRIFAPRYYENSAEKMHVALDEIRALGCRFLVAGRLDEEGIFRSLADVDVPAAFADLFRAIPESIFRSDISSTALRAAGAHGAR